MSDPSSPGPEPAVTVPLRWSATRPLYWSVRREVWDNHSIWVAPLIVAAVFLLGFSVSTIGMPHRREAVLLAEPARQQATVGMPYAVAVVVILATAFMVGVFYCLDALHGERRDRSILFWKSLPVSDLTAVLAKAAIPLVVLPLITFCTVVTVHVLMHVLSALVLLASGLGVAALRPQLELVLLPLDLAYALPVIALWHAPVYAWLLLVSAWARRAVILWAMLPFILVAVFESVALRSSHVTTWLAYRLFGWMAAASDGEDRLAAVQLTSAIPLKLLAAPGLWIGVAIAVALLAAAVRLRRRRGPL